MPQQVKVYGEIDGDIESAAVTMTWRDDDNNAILITADDELEVHTVKANYTHSTGSLVVSVFADRDDDDVSDAHEPLLKDTISQQGSTSQRNWEGGRRIGRGVDIKALGVGTTDATAHITVEATLHQGLSESPQP